MIIDKKIIWEATGELRPDLILKGYPVSKDNPHQLTWTSAYVVHWTVFDRFKNIVNVRELRGNEYRPICFTENPRLVSRIGGIGFFFPKQLLIEKYGLIRGSSELMTECRILKQGCDVPRFKEDESEVFVTRNVSINDADFVIVASYYWKRYAPFILHIMKKNYYSKPIYVLHPRQRDKDKLIIKDILTRVY